MRRIFLMAACWAFIPMAGATTRVDQLWSYVRAAESTSAMEVQASQAIEVAFSPNGGGEALVLKTIRSAKSSIRLAAYSFTSPPVVKALIEAKKRGVDVAVLVDYKNNMKETRNNAPKQALNLLVNAGIATRTISAYPIHHDKYSVVDGRHTQTGSFNYSAAAAKRNSENVLVIWNNPQVAKQYIDHWQSRWQQGSDYQSTY